MMRDFMDHPLSTQADGIGSTPASCGRQSRVLDFANVSSQSLANLGDCGEKAVPWLEQRRATIGSCSCKAGLYLE